VVDLDALKALLEKATPGKWDWGEPWAGFCAFTVDGKTVIYTATADCMEPFISGIDQADGASHWLPGGWPTVGEFKTAHEALAAIAAAKGEK